MSGADIVGKLIQDLRSRSHMFVLRNFYFGAYECDVFSMLPNGYTHEYEVKISRSDFLNDENKTNYGGYKMLDLVQGKRTNKFYYVVPEGLIVTEEVKPFAGLIYFNGSSFKIVKEAKMLHKRKVEKSGLMWHIANRCYFRYMNVKSKP